MSSLVSSWTNYLAKAFRQRDSVAKEQTYPPGRDPFYLIYSLQYVATILATDRGQIPESLRHYADKFQWAIFQIKFGDNSNLRKTCDIEVRDQLFGTAVVCSIIFFGSFLLRECARFLIGKWSRGQIGIRNSPGTLSGCARYAVFGTDLAYGAARFSVPRALGAGLVLDHVVRVVHISWQSNPQRLRGMGNHRHNDPHFPPFHWPLHLPLHGIYRPTHSRCNVQH